MPHYDSAVVSTEQYLSRKIDLNFKDLVRIVEKFVANQWPELLRGLPGPLGGTAGDRLLSRGGETKTEAVTQALRERIQRVRRARAKRRLADELDEIALHCSTLPVLDRRSTDEIMGYDENGIPR